MKRFHLDMTFSMPRCASNIPYRCSICISERLGKEEAMSRALLPAMLSALLEPNPSVIIASFLVVVSIPILLHIFLFRASGRTTLATFLLLGPSGAGKTSLLTLVTQLPFSSLYLPLPMARSMAHPVLTALSFHDELSSNGVLQLQPGPRKLLSPSKSPFPPTSCPPHPRTVPRMILRSRLFRDFS